MSYVLGGTFIRLVRSYTHGCWALVLLPFPSLSFFFSLIPLPIPPATLKPTSMAILRRFLRCQVPLLLWDIARICGILGHAFRTVRLFASRGSCGRGNRYGRIFLRNVARSPYKGRLREFTAFLASLIRSQIKGYDDAYSWIRRFKYKNDKSEMNHKINECAFRGFLH